MDVQNRLLDSIVPYANNAKKHDKKQIANVAESIRQYGFVQPIVIDRDGVIVIGHCRALAAKKLGMKEVPCVCVDDLMPEQVNALRIVDNKSNESEWDFDILPDELAELDLSGFDFDFGFDDEGETEIVEDEAPEVDEDAEPIAKLGDIWQLGRHRLMCGSSTDKETVELLMNGNKADMVFTDPPYGMKKEKDGVLNDNLNYDDLLDFNKNWIPLTFDALKENGSWYCWGIDELLMDIYSEILKPMQKRNEITFRNLITWDKGHGQGQLLEGFRMYPTADEKCLFVMCGVQGFNNNADNYFEAWEPIRLYLVSEWRKISEKNNWDEYLGNFMGKHYFTKSQWTLPTREQYEKLQKIGREYGAFKREYDEIKREYYSTRAYFDNCHDNMNNVWHFERTGTEERELTGGHATPKPIALCGRAIKSSSRETECVLDVFGGSGSTLIACEQLNRTCYMMELDERYVSVIINRYLNLTGRKDEIFCIRDGQKLTYDEVFN